MVTTMVHEFGHMFITFLAEGRSKTPRNMPDKAGALQGEAGDELELLLFGGFHVVTNNDEDNAQVCSKLRFSTKGLACELINILVWRPSPA